MAVSCGAAVAAVDGTSFSFALLWVAVILGLVATSWRYAMVAVLLSAGCAQWHHDRIQRLDREKAAIQQGVWVTFQARITETPRSGDRSWRCMAQVLQSDRDTAGVNDIFLYGSGPAPELGRTIACRGRWTPVPPARNAGEFDRAAHLRRMGAVAECFIRDWQPVNEVPLFWQFTSRARSAFAESITRGLPAGEDAAKVILAMVMGLQPSYEDDVIEPFRQTGTLHLFSVSGQHVNLVAVILWAMLRLCRMPRRGAILLLIPAVFAYAWLTGASPPAVRAAWMAAIFLSAFLVQRRGDLMQSLAVVFIAALLWDSNLLFLAGVQLSYGIVAVICIGLSLSRKPLESWAWNDSYLPRELQTPWQTRCGAYWQNVLQSLVISTAACLGSTPLTIRYFSLVTPISIVTNLALTPLVACLLGLAIFSAGVGVISPDLSKTCNRLNAWFAESCISCSRFFAGIPGGHAVVSAHQPATDTIRIYDLPRGGAAVLVQCRDADVLLDVGNERAFRSIILPSLRYGGSEPDTILLSHPDASHIGGTLPAMNQLNLRQIIAPVAAAKSPSFRALKQQAWDRNIPVYCARQGVTWTQSENVTWEMLHVPAAHDIHRLADDRSAIYGLQFHGFHLLFLNDASAIEVQTWARRKGNFRCDVIILGRHGIHSPALGDLIQEFSPRAVIATHADFPEAEKIPAAWHQQAEQAGIPFFPQGDTGMVTLQIRDDRSLQITSFLGSRHCTLAPAP